jgi:hypothetical protein
MDVGIVARIAGAEDLGRTQLAGLLHEATEMGIVGVDGLAIDPVNIKRHACVVA